MSAERRPFGPCARDDLAAIVLQETYWHVDKDGSTSDFRTGGDFRGIEQYTCMKCGRCFEPDDSVRPSDWERAWQAALAHVGVKEAV